MPPSRSRQWTSLSIFVLLAVACIDMEDPAPSTGKVFTPDPGASYTIVGVQSGKCVEAPAGARAGSAAQLRACSVAANRRFRADVAGAGFHRLRNAETNLCLDVQGASTADGAGIILWPCSNEPNQQWSFPEVSPGVVWLVARHSKRVLDVAGAATTDGAGLIQWLSNKQANQQFRLQVVPVAVPAPAAGGAGGAAPPAAHAPAGHAPAERAPAERAPTGPASAPDKAAAHRPAPGRPAR